MPIQRFTMGRMPGLAKVVRSTIAMLRFPKVVTVQRPLLNRVSLGEELRQIPTHPSKAHFPQQVIPNRTSGSTCCPGVSTPMTWSLADLSLTNHKP
jgi:hypothetical protein